MIGSSGCNGHECQRWILWSPVRGHAGPIRYKYIFAMMQLIPFVKQGVLSDHAHSYYPISCISDPGGDLYLLL